MKAKGGKDRATGPASRPATPFFGKSEAEEFFPSAPASPQAFFGAPAAQLQRQEAAPVEDEPELEAEAAEAEEEALRRKPEAAAGDDPGAEEGATAPLAARLAARGGRGAPLPEETRGRMEGALGRDLGGVRVHRDGEAAAMADSLGAEAFTHGANIYFNRGRWDEASRAGARLLAHELTHVVQQGGAGAQPVVRRQAMEDDPARFTAVHQNLFVPGGSGAPALAWEAGSEAELIRQFKAAVHQGVVDRPSSLLGEPPQNTTETQAERDAETANDQIVGHFGQLTSRLSTAAIQAAVEVMPAGQAPDRNFMEQWVANKLAGTTEIRRFGLAETDPRFEGVVNALIADGSSFDLGPVMLAVRRLLEERLLETHRIDRIIVGHRQAVAPGTWARILEILAGRQAAFAERGQRIVLSSAIDPAKRMLTLIHEFVHFYAHATYKSWVQGTTNARFFDEGFTEFLARQAMTPQQRTERQGQPNNYADRLEAITNDVLPFTTVDEIAAAYFHGEVWRLEHTSQQAGQAFGDQIGIQPDATRDEEATQSRAAPGINQTVRDGRQYRFMNLGIEESEPKPEHRTLLQTVINDVVLADPDLRIRFVGHASSPGSQSFNRRLSDRRARAFDALARELGVPESQLIHPGQPEFEGEVAPTAGNESVIGRAMNRRVELFIVPPGSARLEDNVFRLGRLRGRGVPEDGMTVSTGAAAVLRNTPDPAEELPFIEGGGWNATEILDALGQYDRIAGTDSDALRCVQAVAMASYIPGGPEAVRGYLELIAQQGRSTRQMNDRRRTALEVIDFVRGKLANRSATFGDLSWAQEAVHDLFFDDVSGTDEREIHGQVTPTLDGTRAMQRLSLWTSNPAELMAQAETLQPGEQLLVNTWQVLFNEAFSQLRDDGVTITNPMVVEINGREVTISEIPAGSRPAPTDIDPNRDQKKGHQLLVFRDNSRRLWLYEPEVNPANRHLLELTGGAAVLERYFTEHPQYEIYDYVQILGRVTPVSATPATTPAAPAGSGGGDR